MAAADEVRLRTSVVGRRTAIAGRLLVPRGVELEHLGTGSSNLRSNLRRKWITWMRHRFRRRGRDTCAA
ncbi:hypothetical protein JSE7799_03132 [Jannaschia seosinensis]|uniref:Uncharacterized protein n=1 Tax=Jannaschia seosinensis TaxID=313367 RepID=A0A0M7BCD8_9RHOB|nr:hypothetical protein JSE7799_03132 [Jannaschia seosinensis]